MPLVAIRFMLGTLKKLPVISWRKAGMTSSPHGPYGSGLHTCYNGGDSGQRHVATTKLILQKPSQFRLDSATRVHEVGIASNRRSACYGEYVLGPCTHRPSRHGSWFYLKPVSLTFARKQPSTVGSATGAKS